MAAGERLKRNREFSRVYRHGSYQKGHWLGLHAQRRKGLASQEQPRVGFTVSRVIRGAVGRNRAKRLLREAYRLSQVDSALGYDLIVTARWKADEEPVFASLKREMEELLIRSGAARPLEASQEDSGD